MIRATTRIQRVAALLALAGSLGACSVGSEGGSGFTESIGLTTPPPDEFAVVANRELEMPSSFDLPVPNPGAPSRVEVRPEDQARAALFSQTGSETGGPSASEAALLSAAGAGAADPNIRQTVAAEQEEYVETNTRFGLSTFAGYKIPGPVEAEALDADDEARRLAAEGVQTPIAPDPPPDAQ